MFKKTILLAFLAYSTSLFSQSAHQLDFVRATAPGANSASPAHDIIFNNDPNYPKYLHLEGKQIVPIKFQANIYNAGTNAQSNVRLQVEIWDANANNLLSTLSSPSVANLNANDTAYHTTLVTPNWTPAFAGDYHFVYKAVSDSIAASSISQADTFDFYLSDRYSNDDGRISNYFNSNSDPNKILEISTQFKLKNPDPAGSPGMVYLKGFELQLGCQTDSTAQIVLEIRDTTSYIGLPPGFSLAAVPIYRRTYNLNSSSPCSLSYFSLLDTAGQPLALPVGVYFANISFYPNAINGVIEIANSNTWEQPIPSSIYLNSLGDWSSKIGNSDTFVAPHFRLYSGSPSLGLEALSELRISIYPNPSSGRAVLNFPGSGSFNIELRSLDGLLILSQRVRISESLHYNLELNGVSEGIYLLYVRDEEGRQETIKLSIQS